MIIFDLDGTIANCEHRRHFVDPSYVNEEEATVEYHCDMKGNITRAKGWQPNWKSFYEACDKDTPIQPIVDIWNSHEVELALGRWNVMIWSGRCESVRQKTIDWLEEHLYCPGTYFFDRILKMRPVGDSTPDDELKEKWLDEYLNATPIKEHKIDFVFDDRPKVVRMWRRRGVFVFDVNQKEGEF